MIKVKKIVFVCLGNICRSPMGEGAFIDLIEKHNCKDEFIVDSAGTSAFHVGEKADSRMRDVANSNGVKLMSRARQFVTKDLEFFDYIIAMDRSNYRDILSLDSKYEEKIFLLREYDEYAMGDLDVPDPYYGGLEGFENVYQIVTRSCEQLLKSVKK